MKAYAPGIYARSQELVQATRDLDRGRTTNEAVEEQVARDEAALVAAQERAGLDFLSDGMLRWQDLFRPLADAAEGLEARPLTRFLDTNTFYRALIVDGRPRLVRPVPAPALPEGRWLGTLPSPLALARATGGAATAQELAAAVLGPQLEVWAQAGAALVVLSDPFLAREGGVEDLIRGLEELPGDVPLALHLPFGDASHVLELLADAPVQAVGIDFYATPLDSVPERYPKEITAGVVDARSSAPEDPEEIATFVHRLGERKPAGIATTPNGDLQFVPERIARDKVACLRRVRAAVGDEVAAS